MNVRIDRRLYSALCERITEIIPCAVSGADWVHIPDYAGAEKGTWQSNRYIQIYDGRNGNEGWIHYEYGGGYVCLHLEGEYADRKYIRQIRELKRMSRQHDGIRWLPSEGDCICCIVTEEVTDMDDLVHKFRRLADIFGKSLDALFDPGVSTLQELRGEYVLPNASYSERLSEDEVAIHTLGMADLFDLALSIPDYQRIYCWENSQIESLWAGLSAIRHGASYHLGTVILQHRGSRYEIVDGQQRLVTLSLILWELGYKGNIPLLNERFRNDDAIRHVMNAKAVISALLMVMPDNGLLDTILCSVKFSVIVINGDNLDLGYTFFSNQNSKGVRLTDYDLLKAHHLRYISSEPQAIHLANGWTRLTTKQENHGMPVELSLGRHVYRLRKLLRKVDFNEYGHYVRDEFQSAPTMADVPPFGERFDFFEPIQGGAHFFAFVGHFHDRYNTFICQPQVESLRENFGRRHRVYGTLAETVLFAYYLKFGAQYLSETLFCIMSKLAEHRYKCARALELQVQKYVTESNLVQLIQFSTSPTFFLAEALAGVRTGILDYDIKDGIRWNFYERMCDMFASFTDVTVAEIAKRIENEY